MLSKSSPLRALVPVAVVVGFALLAGCSTKAEVDISRAADATTPGYRLGDRAVPDDDDDVELVDAGSDAAGLPPRNLAVSALVGSGLTESQATCAYDAVADDPAAAAEVARIYGAATGATGAPATATATATASATAPSLTAAGATTLVNAIAPCLDATTLAALGGVAPLAPTPGAASTPGSAAGSTTVPAIDPAQLLAALSSVLPDTPGIEAAITAARAEQARQVQVLLTALASRPQTPVPPVPVNLGGVDLANLTPEQTPLALLALLNALSPEQRAQLAQLTKLRLDQLQLQVGPEGLSPDQVGGILLIIGPLLAGALNPATPPPGQDPGQVYIPPGADLSHLNPILFLNRDGVIAELQRNGIPPAVGGCAYDRLSRLEPTTLAMLFAPDAENAALGALTLTLLSCSAGI